MGPSELLPRRFTRTAWVGRIIVVRNFLSLWISNCPLQRRVVFKFTDGRIAMLLCQFLPFGSRNHVCVISAMRVPSVLLHVTKSLAWPRCRLRFRVDLDLWIWHLCSVWINERDHARFFVAVVAVRSSYAGIQESKKSRRVSYRRFSRLTSGVQSSWNWTSSNVGQSSDDIRYYTSLGTGDEVNFKFSKGVIMGSYFQLCRCTRTVFWILAYVICICTIFRKYYQNNAKILRKYYEVEESRRK